MPKITFVLSSLVIVAGLAGAGLVAMDDRFGLRLMLAHSVTPGSAKMIPAVPLWDAAAPGRVQPKGGEIRLAAPVPGVIREVLAGVNDKVRAGDLLLRLDDEEAQAKLAAAKAEAAMRLAERDSTEARGLALDRRKAEDRLYAAERSLFDARMELDRLISRQKSGHAAEADIEKARSSILAAAERVEQEAAQLRRLQGAEKMPAPVREEAALNAARAEVSAASAAIERLRIRSPLDGWVLDINVKPGELARSGIDGAILTLGDVTHLQIKAEVEERDAAKIHPSQIAVVKSDAFPGRPFNAVVSLVSRALDTPKLGSRGQRRPNDIDVLEVLLDLDDGTPLLPGMRVDVLFRGEDAAPKSSYCRDCR